MTKSNIYYVNSLQNPIYFINSLIIYSHFKFCEIEVQLPIDDIWLKTCFFFFPFFNPPRKKVCFSIHGIFDKMQQPVTTPQSPSG